MKQASLTLWAPAKINLSLGVGARRADGYHEIRSVMQKISLYDTLSFSRSKETGLKCDLKYLPTDERNLCVRAANAYFKAAGISGGVQIRVRKAIPVGAGLGGGSADAALCLHALTRLYEPLPEEKLFDIALSLGADVPFCFSKHTACLCEGVGERLTPLKKADGFEACVLLVKDDRKLSTAQVYQAFDALPARPMTGDEALLNAIETGDVRGMSRSLFNMLEPAVFSQKPALASLCDRLLSLGALGARMSGAGPTVYGVFDSRAAALRAAQSFFDAEFCRVASLLS